MSLFLGAKNSLIEQTYDNKFAYPSDPELCGYVKDYFDYFFRDVLDVNVARKAAGM